MFAGGAVAFDGLWLLEPEAVTISMTVGFSGMQVVSGGAKASGGTVLAAGSQYVLEGASASNAAASSSLALNVSAGGTPTDSAGEVRRHRFRHASARERHPARGHQRHGLGFHG